MYNTTFYFLLAQTRDVVYADRFFRFEENAEHLKISLISTFL